MIHTWTGYVNVGRIYLEVKSSPRYQTVSLRLTPCLTRIGTMTFTTPYLLINDIFLACLTTLDKQYRAAVLL